MNLQEFRPLADAGVPWSEIARLAGCDPRTAKKYLSGPPRLPCYRSRPAPGRVIDPFIGTIDAWLRASKGALCATTIYERLAAEPYRFGGSYQRVKQYVRARRPEICAELGIPDRSAQMHRRFEVAPGAQAQVDWGDEGVLADGTHVSSFHMVLSYSRDPFCRYTTATDLATFSRLPHGGLRALRRRAADGPLRPHQDGGQEARRPRRAGDPAPRGRGLRRPLRLRDPCLLARAPAEQGPRRARRAAHPGEGAGRTRLRLSGGDGRPPGRRGCRSVAPRCTAPTAR